MKLNIRGTYKKYKNSTIIPVDIKDYININADYNKFLIEKVLEGKEITLPCRLGTLSIIGRKQKIVVEEDGTIKGLAPDWVKTKELWEKDPQAKKEKKRIFHTNSNTEGIIYRYFWSKKNVIIENKNFYSLRLTRTNKREVNTLVNQGKQYRVKV